MCAHAGALVTAAQQEGHDHEAGDEGRTALTDEGQRDACQGVMMGHVQTRVSIWLDPFAAAQGGGFQLVQSLFSMADGDLFGTGIGRGGRWRPPGRASCPWPHTA